MRIWFIFVITLTLEAQAYSGHRCIPHTWPCFRSWLASSRMFNIIGSNSNYEEYLKVCQLPVLRTTLKNVEQGFDESTERLRNVVDAMDKNAIKELLAVIDESQKSLSSRIASIEGTMYAMIQASENSSVPDIDAQCVQQVLSRFRMFQSSLRDVQSRTEQAIVLLEQDIDEEHFQEYFERLSKILEKLQQFIEDPQQTQDLQKQCEEIDPSHVIFLIVDNLKSLEYELLQQNQSTRINAVKASVGLLAEAITLNSVCHGVQNVYESFRVQTNVMYKDIKASEDATDSLETEVKKIVGRPSLFRRLIGY